MVNRSIDTEVDSDKMHRVQEGKEEADDSYYRDYDDRKRRNKRGFFYRRDPDNIYRNAESRRDEGESVSKWESSRAYRRGKYGSSYCDTRSDHHREYRQRGFYGRDNYQREHYTNPYNHENGGDGIHPSNQTHNGASGEMQYNCNIQSSNKNVSGDKQNEWSLHTSGRYYISNSSPWCYNQEFGYFYFGYNGEIIHQNSVHDVKMQAEDQKKYPGNTTEDQDSAFKTTLPKAVDLSSATKEAASRTSVRHNTNPFLKQVTLREISSEVVAQAMALSSLPLPDSHETLGRSSPNRDYTAIHKDASKLNRHKPHFSEERSTNSRKRRPSDDAEALGQDNDRYNKSLQVKKEYNSIVSEVPSKDECLLLNTPKNNESVRARSVDGNASSQSHAESYSGESSAYNIFDTDNTESKASLANAEGKSPTASDLKSTTSSRYSQKCRSTAHKTRNTLDPDHAKKDSEPYYSDLGAYYGYHYWSEEQKKYVYVPPDPPQYLNSSENDKNQLLMSDMRLGHQNLSRCAPRNRYGNSVLKLVVLSSPRLNSGSVIIVESSGLTIGRSQTDGKNRLAVREIEISRTHCSIFMSLMITPGELSSASECRSIPKSNSDTSSDKNHKQCNHNSEEHSTDASESGEIYSLCGNSQYRNSEFDDLVLERLPDRKFSEAFFIIDSGSTRGTFLNDERLSASKIVSEPMILKHKDILKLGATTFEVHIHPEWPCDKCCITRTNMIQTNGNKDELTRCEGLIKPTVENTKVSLEKARLLELKKLKKRILNTKDKDQITASDSAPRTKYVDRAAIRRNLYKDDKPELRGAMWDEQYGARNPTFSSRSPTYYHFPSETIEESPEIASESTGSKMLKKMGWTEGQGLGAKNSGKTEPVPVTMRIGRAGLGSSQTLPSGIIPLSADQRYLRGQSDNRAESTLEATKKSARERFYNI